MKYEQIKHRATVAVIALLMQKLLLTVSKLPSCKGLLPLAICVF